MKNSLGIYIHIPFCIKKCAYCDFYSLPLYQCARYTAHGTCEGQITNNDNIPTADRRPPTTRPNDGSSILENYVERLCQDVEKHAPLFKNHTVDTIYFGGGTPTVLYKGAFYRILNAISKHFSTYNPEITSEANPESLTAGKAAELKYVGVNRVSVGLQAADDGLLKILGRTHTVSDFLNAVDNLKRAGVDNIGADIILGLPGQTMERVESTMKLLLNQNTFHISSYALKLEKGTKLYKKFSILNSQLQTPSDDATADMYDLVYDTLTSNGYKRYEVSNFAKPGYECKHNLKYWTMQEYLGLGAAAHSYYGGVRYSNSRSLNYRTKRTPQTPLDDFNDTIMLGLRTEHGIDCGMIKQKYGRDLLSDPAVIDLIKRGFLLYGQRGGGVGRLRIVPEKFYVMNSIILSMFNA